MINLDGQTVLAGGLAVLGGVTWLIRLEGKANGALEKYTTVLKKLDTVEGKVDGLTNILLTTHLQHGSGA